MKDKYKTTVIQPDGKYHLRDGGKHGRIILKLTLKKQYVRVWTGFM
jgi:hypothetical protein